MIIVKSLFFLERKIRVHGVAAVSTVDDAADHGGLNGGGNINGHGALFTHAEGAEGGLIL